MSANTIGVKDTREVVSFVATLYKAFGRAMDDGKVNLKDLPLLFPVLLDVKSAFEGIDRVDLEIANWTFNEQMELRQLIVSEFGLGQDAEQDVADVMEAINGMVRLLQMVLRKANKGGA